MNAAPGSSKLPPGATPDEINASCRLPLLYMFLCGAAWLVISSGFAFLASVKFHQPAFLADTAWLTYGRVRPAELNSLLYGFGVQSGLAVLLWLLARLGQTRLAQPWIILAGAKLWNLGVAVGVIGILAGDSTGYETLDFPRYAAPFLFLGYSLIGLWGLVTFHRRRPTVVFPASWFFVAALFWFPWIYTTAILLISFYPAPGVVQALVAWWYAANLQVVWIGLVGLGILFFLLPTLTRCEFQSRPLALLIFWLLIFFGGWTGIPNGAPLPASWSALSAATAFVSLATLVAVACSVRATLGGNFGTLFTSAPLRFCGFAAFSFLLAGLLAVVAAPPQIGRIVGLTWFTPARLLLGSYGFFAMIIFAAAYHIVPQLTKTSPPPGLGRFHFLLASVGTLVLTLPLVVGGALQGLKLADATSPFMDSAAVTTSFLRFSTLGILALLVGNLLFLASIGRLAANLVREEALKAYAAGTAELKPAGANA